MKNELQYSLVLNSAKRNHARMGAIKEASVAEYQVHGKENQEFLWDKWSILFELVLNIIL